MKPCHENNGAACNLCWKGCDPAQSFVLTYTPQLNVSIGQLLRHMPNSIVVCAGSRLKRQTKTYNKGVCQVSYHCL